MISSLSSQSYISTYSVLQTSALTQTTQTSDLVSTEDSDSYTNSTIYGFKADDNGFMDPKLNKMAGVPTSVKIHTKTLEDLTAYAKNTNSGFDTVQALSKAWSFFTDLVGNSVDTSGNTYLSSDDVANTPHTYTYDGTIFGKVLSTTNLNSESSKIWERAQVEGYSQGKLNVGQSTFYGWNVWDGRYEDVNKSHEETKAEHTQKRVEYINKIYRQTTGVLDKSVPENMTSLGELFGVFAQEEISLYPNGRAQEVQNYYDFLKSGDSLETYLDKTFGDGYVDGLRQDFINNSEVHDGREGEMFDYFLRELNELNKKYYEQNKNHIDNHKLDDFKNFDNLTLDIEQGDILNFNI